MTEYSLKQLAEITKGELSGEEFLTFSSLSIDSRKINTSLSTLFIAIKGERHDGHLYINEMVEKGIRCFLISDKTAIPESAKECGFVVVKSTTRAFHELARFHRNSFTLPVLAITGSNGKTIVKEWISAGLGIKHKVTRSPKSYNSQVGVPLSLWLLDNESEFGVFEAGISKPGEMEALNELIRPDYGIITNIGEAHQENFSSHNEKLLEKIKLFKGCKKIFYCSDHTLIHEELVKQFNAEQLVSWSTSSIDASLHIISLKTIDKSTEVELKSKYGSIKLKVPFTDKAGIENAIQTFNFLIYQGYSESDLKQVISNIHPVAMRLEQLSGINNCILINDSYNSDINSLQIALDYMNQQKGRPGTIILSDIEQSGKSSTELYEQIALSVQRAGIKKFIGIGPGLMSQKENFGFLNSAFYLSGAALIESGMLGTLKNENILIKGARSFRFENIVHHLAEKNHTTVLEINLNNLLHNLNYFRSLLKSPTRIMVMVKALAYGSGGNEIATLLQHEKVDYMGVAFTDEGVQLRQEGINIPIMVMSPGKEDFERIIDNDLEPEIYSFNILKNFIETAKRLQVSEYPIHLKIDTGMHRLGFLPREIPTVIDLVKSSGTIKLQAVFSHLAASDAAKHDEFTKHQIKTFNLAYKQISSALGYNPIRHILNSAGIERYPEAHFEMVRLGIGLHGISALNADVKPVSTLKTHISQIKQIDSGETVGYNRRGLANQDIKIAIIPVGYADGLDRKFGNGNGEVIIAGQTAPFIGDICMDMSMINITDIVCSEGDEVILFGEENPITKLAEKINTIPYEILTNVSSRVKRVFYKD